MDQLLTEFLDEAEELIEGLAEDAQALRNANLNGRNRRELVARIFRHAHSLKGASSSVGQTAIADLTHNFETILDRVRSGRSILSDPVLDVFDDTISSISQMLDDVANVQQPIVPTELFERLRTIAEASGSETNESDAGSRALDNLPVDIAGTLNESEEYRLREAVNEGAGIFAVEINFELSTLDSGFKELTKILSNCGEIVSTQPGAAATSPDQLGFRILFTTHETPTQLKKILAEAGSSSLKELWVRAANDDEGTLEKTNTLDEPESDRRLPITPRTTRARIDLSELDDVILASSELFKETNDVLDTLTLLDQLARNDRADLKLRVEQIRRHFADLESSLKKLRTTPVAHVMARAIRAGAAAARTTGKEIDFDTEGGELRIEQSLSDAIADSLIHLLRNAVDHGIESPSERVALGKSQRGLIKLDALVGDGEIRLRVIDNGRGIDPVQVTRIAVERGIIKGDSEAAREGDLRIIFAPGFSTTETVSNVSGRGVGLDVVSRSVDRLCGKILVVSELGVGTTFELLLPVQKPFVES